MNLSFYEINWGKNTIVKSLGQSGIQVNRVYSFSGCGRNVKETEQTPAHVGQSAVVYITIHAKRSGRMLSVLLIPGMPEGM